MPSLSDDTTLEFPCGALSLKSPFYIERPPVETSCHQNLQIAGSLTRIKGPRHIGKSSLLLRLLDHAHRLNYRTISIDFQSAESDIYQSLTRFLRWFCSAAAHGINLPTCLDEYWDEDVGAKLSTTLYFREYLLEAVSEPIVLALNEVNRVFEHPVIARDFLPLLRVWYEQAKQERVEEDSEQTIGFQKLRILVVHSTDVYVSLNVNQSPFNVGLPISLKPFNNEQIWQLAQRYGVMFEKAHYFQAIKALVGGHPYLLAIAFYYLKQGQLSPERLVAEAPTAAGIYQHHLQECLEIAQSQPRLLEALQQIVTADMPIEIDVAIAHQLSSLGLVILEGNTCHPSCELYRLFFSQHRLTASAKLPEVKRLQTENERLKVLANLDGLTQIANRRLFEERSNIAWETALKHGTIVSLIMLDIDFFKRYNDHYGHLSGDFCLKQVAQVLRDRISRAAATVARYGGEEFAIILPETTLEDATKLAHQLKEGILSLKISHEASEITAQIVTASIGVASIVPRLGQSFLELVAAADKALYVSKQQGRNRVTSNNALLVASIESDW